MPLLVIPLIAYQMAGRKEKLEQLATEIADEIEAEPFLFPSEWGVGGYFGTGKVVFAAYKPSMDSNFPTRGDRLFYGTLITYGLENVHITDLSKEPGESDTDITPPERQRNIPFFEQELDILDAELVVALGERAETELGWMEATDNIETMRVNHYAWASRWGEEETFITQMKEVYQRARELEII